MAKEKKSSVLNNYIANSLNNWSNLKTSNLNNSMIEIKKIDERFENLPMILETPDPTIYESEIELLKQLKGSKKPWTNLMFWF